MGYSPDVTEQLKRIAASLEELVQQGRNRSYVVYTPVPATLPTPLVPYPTTFPTFPDTGKIWCGVSSPAPNLSGATPAYIVNPIEQQPPKYTFAPTNTASLSSSREGGEYKVGVGG